MPEALVIADLHRDFWEHVGRDPLQGHDISDVDLLILAGDATNKGHVQWRHLFDWLGARIDLDRVHIFPGNHDPYGGKIDREDKLEALCEEAGAHWAQKREIVLGRRRFLCCTLWTDMRLGPHDPETHMRMAAETMNDYRTIRLSRDGYRRLQPIDTARIHADHRDWLEERLAAPWDGETIVVTHHAPHPEALTEPGGLPCAYASDLSGLISRTRPHAWIFGHTHQPVDLDLDGTRLLNASIGYPPELEPDRPAGDPRTGRMRWTEAAEPACPD